MKSGDVWTISSRYGSWSFLTDNGFKLKTYFFRQPWNGFVLVAPEEVLPNVVGRQTRERSISLVEIRQDFTHGDERLLIEYSRIDFLLPWRDVPKPLVLVACGIEQYSRGFRSNSVELVDDLDDWTEPAAFRCDTPATQNKFRDHVLLALRV